MSLLEDVRKMKIEGRNEQQIVDILKQGGVPLSDIENTLSQLRIKEAISAGSEKKQGNNFEGEGEYGIGDRQMTEEYGQQGEGYEGMEPSMTADAMQQEYQQEGQDYQQQGQGYQQQGYPADYGMYPEYQSYGGVTSPDVVTEIAEQVVTEKLSKIREGVEQTLDFRAAAEAKLENLSDRLKRIEAIIDRLQLSILQKIGEYAGNVSDLKKEIIETQKSFKVLEPHIHITKEHKRKRKKRTPKAKKRSKGKPKHHAVQHSELHTEHNPGHHLEHRG
jgi:hypothetical protein